LVDGVTPRLAGNQDHPLRHHDRREESRMTRVLKHLALWETLHSTYTNNCSLQYSTDVTYKGATAAPL